MANLSAADKLKKERKKLDEEIKAAERFISEIIGDAFKSYTEKNPSFLDTFTNVLETEVTNSQRRKALGLKPIKKEKKTAHAG